MVALSVREDSYMEDEFTMPVSLRDVSDSQCNAMGIKCVPLYSTLHVRLMLWPSSTQWVVETSEVITGREAATTV